ncbi:uncharacterized protein [Rutidosis leptorrhynchoides]|uniref:uncharacterized protein n=1 Tax=Rutidosis leptorrhynchoides TaxID=125765 RepID=UPI003A98F424
MELKLTPFAAITTKKPNINIRCKLLSIETFSKPNVDNGAPYLEVIAINEKGDRICITLKNHMKKKHENLLKEQEAYIVQNIYVQNNFNINKLNHWVHSYVIGKVQYYYREPKSYGSNTDEKSKYINLELKDLEGSVIRCTLFRDYMVKFLGHMKIVKDDECVILFYTEIQFPNSNVIVGHLTVSTDWNFTRIFIDSDLSCIADFRTSILANHNNEDSEVSLAPSMIPSLTHPTKDIDEWFAKSTCVTCDDLSFESPGFYVILAEIITIEPDMPWCYISCKKCHKTAKPVSKEVDLTLDIDQQLALKLTCSGTCGDNPQVALRFKVIVRVADDYDTATLTIFETVVNKYVTKSAYLLKKSLKEDDDQPEELEALLGNTLLFRLEITGYNKKYTTSNYILKDVTTDESFIQKYKELNLIQKAKNASISGVASTSDQSPSVKLVFQQLFENCVFFKISDSTIFNCDFTLIMHTTKHSGPHTNNINKLKGIAAMPITNNVSTEMKKGTTSKSPPNKKIECASDNQSDQSSKSKKLLLMSTTK